MGQALVEYASALDRVQGETLTALQRATVAQGDADQASRSQRYCQNEADEADRR